jgi:cyanamide hydratase
MLTYMWVDNVGKFPDLVAKGTIESVVKLYPRHQWSGCFAGIIREEIGAKPWAHSTVIENFAEMVENNELMAPYDNI